MQQKHVKLFYTSSIQTLCHSFGKEAAVDILAVENCNWAVSHCLESNWTAMSSSVYLVTRFLLLLLFDFVDTTGTVGGNSEYLIFQFELPIRRLLTD